MAITLNNIIYTIYTYIFFYYRLLTQNKTIYYLSISFMCKIQWVAYTMNLKWVGIIKYIIKMNSN